jgi:hypothetical protein
MTIKTAAELLAAFADNQERAITEQDIRNLVDSMTAVGGVMYLAGESFGVTTSWQPFTAWTDSTDTKGIAEDFLDGTFTIEAGADGAYAIDVSIGVTAPGNGWIEFALAKNGTLTPFRMKQTMAAGDDGSLSIHGGAAFVEGDTLAVAVRASGNATVVLSNGQFRAIRIG